jgi:hypothetical protein
MYNLFYSQTGSTADSFPRTLRHNSNSIFLEVRTPFLYLMTTETETKEESDSNVCSFRGLRWRLFD